MSGHIHRRLAELRAAKKAPTVQTVQTVQYSPAEAEISPQALDGAEEFGNQADGGANRSIFPQYSPQTVQYPPSPPERPSEGDVAPGAMADAIEERAAIVEFDGGIARGWAEAFARMCSGPPPGLGASAAAMD